MSINNTTQLYTQQRDTCMNDLKKMLDEKLFKECIEFIEEE